MLENLTTEELCVMLEDDELITINMIKEAVRRLRELQRRITENDS